MTPEGSIRGHDDPRLRIRHDPFSGLVAVYDASSREAVLWFPDAGEIPWSERASPLWHLAGWALAGDRVALLHGAAVGGRAGGVLLSGPSGSGKSVTALAALAAGLRYAGDDHVLVSLDPGPVAHSLSRFGRVPDSALERVAGLSAAVVGRVGAPYAVKAVVDARRVGPAAVAREVELSAVVIPRVAQGGRARLRRIDAASALRHLAPSTVFFLSQESGSAMAAMAELVRRVPTYGLDLTGDAAQAASQIEELCGGA